jgi:hypothetical protein
MKTILATLALALMVTGASAASPTIPKQFRGDWCGAEDESTTDMHRCKTYSNTNFRIKAHTYGAIKSNWTCTFTSILSDGSAAITHSLCVRDETRKMRSIFLLNDDGSLTFL